MTVPLADRHLEILLRVDERVNILVQRVDASIAADTAALETQRINVAALSTLVSANATEIRMLKNQATEMAKTNVRITALEDFKKTVLLITAGVSAAFTLLINKLVAMWPWS
jgi:hypothetical protein